MYCTTNLSQLLKNKNNVLSEIDFCDFLVLTIIVCEDNIYNDYNNLEINELMLATQLLDSLLVCL
jgi:hypothetical protein